MEREKHWNLFVICFIWEISGWPASNDQEAVQYG